MAISVLSFQRLKREKDILEETVQQFRKDKERLSDANRQLQAEKERLDNKYKKELLKTVWFHPHSIFF